MIKMYRIAVVVFFFIVSSLYVSSEVIKYDNFNDIDINYTFWEINSTDNPLNFNVLINYTGIKIIQNNSLMTILGASGGTDRGKALMTKNFYNTNDSLAFSVNLKTFNIDNSDDVLCIGLYKNITESICMGATFNLRAGFFGYDSNNTDLVHPSSNGYPGGGYYYCDSNYWVEQGSTLTITYTNKTRSARLYVDNIERCVYNFTVPLGLAKPFILTGRNPGSYVNNVTMTDITLYNSSDLSIFYTKNKPNGTTSVSLDFDGMVNFSVNVNATCTLNTSLYANQGTTENREFIFYSPLNYQTTGRQTLNVTCIEPNGLYPALSFLYNFNLINLSVDNCTNPSKIETNGTAINISIKNLIGVATDVNYSMNLQSDCGNFNEQRINQNFFSYCVYPSYVNCSSSLSVEYVYLDSIMSYHSETYLNNITKSVTLYVDTETLTAVTAKVYDNFAQELEGAYISVQRYDWGTGNYLNVGVYQTNFEGEVVMYLTLNSAYYRFLIYYPIDELKETTNPTYIYSNSISFSIDTSTPVLDTFYTIENVDTILAYNNASQNFRYIFSDTSSTISKGCLEVYYYVNSEPQLYNSSCVVGVSGIIFLGVDNNTKNWIANGYAYIGDNKYLTDSLSHSFMLSDAKTTIGKMGLIVAVILTIAFAFVLTFSIELGIIMIPLPTLILSAIGFLAVDVQIAILMEVAALVLAVIISRAYR